jgi:hypothetical protein
LCSGSGSCFVFAFVRELSVQIRWHLQSAPRPRIFFRRSPRVSSAHHGGAGTGVVLEKVPAKAARFSLIAPLVPTGFDGVQFNFGQRLNGRGHFAGLFFHWGMMKTGGLKTCGNPIQVGVAIKRNPRFELNVIGKFHVNYEVAYQKV